MSLHKKIRSWVVLPLSIKLSTPILHTHYASWSRQCKIGMSDKIHWPEFGDSF